MAAVHARVGVAVVGGDGGDPLELGLAPLAPAVQVGADQRPAAFAPTGGQQHHLLARRHGHVGVVIAHPAAAAVGGLPRRHAGGAIPRLVHRIDARVQQPTHSIRAGRHQLALVVGAVPQVGLLALGARGHADDVLHAVSLRVVDHQRGEAVEGHGVGERHRPLRLLQVFGGGGVFHPTFRRWRRQFPSNFVGREICGNEDTERRSEPHAARLLARLLSPTRGVDGARQNRKKKLRKIHST